jgi:coproporphyrinogen III oxidase
LFVTAYETFLGVYLDIISKRKGIAYTESDVQLKLERNGKWLEYMTLKDGAVRGALERGVTPPEVLIEMGFPPSVVF